MDAADLAGFWLRHQRIGTRSASNLFPARALAYGRRGECLGGGLELRSISGYITVETARQDRPMASTKSQRKATRTHRRRAAARGLVRVEVQAPRRDAPLIRAVAETLRGRAQEADALRATLAEALVHPEAKTAFDIFGSDLPDEAFEGIFDQPRQRDWREVDL
jgi:hypothetical protein